MSGWSLSTLTEAGQGNPSRADRETLWFDASTELWEERGGAGCAPIVIVLLSAVTAFKLSG